MCKLTDIVTSLWLGIIKLGKELIYVTPVFLDLLNNIIIGINELYVYKYLLDLDLTLMNIWRDHYCLENDYDSKMKLSIVLRSVTVKKLTFLPFFSNLTSKSIWLNITRYIYVYL